MSQKSCVALTYSSLDLNIILPWRKGGLAIVNSTTSGETFTLYWLSLKDWTRYEDMYQWIGVDQRPGYNTMTCILGYPAVFILFRTMASSVVAIYCSERPKMLGNENKMGIIIR